MEVFVLINTTNMTNISHHSRTHVTIVLFFLMMWQYSIEKKLFYYYVNLNK